MIWVYHRIAECCNDKHERIARHTQWDNTKDGHTGQTEDIEKKDTRDTQGRWKQTQGRHKANTRHTQDAHGIYIRCTEGNLHPNAKMTQQHHRQQDTTQYTHLFCSCQRHSQPTL